MKKAMPYIPFACFFLVFLALLQPIDLLYSSDDGAHFEMLEKLGVSGWVLWRAETWEPRLFSDFFYAVFIYRVGAWKVVNAAVGASLMFGLWRASSGPDFLKNDEAVLRTQKNVLLLASSLICVLFFFIYPNAVTSSSVWYTGSFNYLWPVTGLVFGLTPFFFMLRGGDPYPKKIWFPIGVLASLCAGFTEQTTAAALGVSLLILIFCLLKKRSVPAPLFIHFAVIAACAVYFLGSVMTSGRVSGGEELALFPEFAEYGLRNKIALGVNVFDSHLLRSSNLLFLVLASIAGILAYVRLKNNHPVLRTLSFFPAFYALLNILPFHLTLSGAWSHPKNTADTIGVSSAFQYDPAVWFDFMYDVPPLNWAASPKDLFMAALALIAVLFMFYPLFFAFREKANRFLACLLWLAAFASGIVMGFSPTIFASGSRPYFLANIIILLLCAMLVKEGMTSDEPRISNGFLGKTRLSKIIMAIAALFAVYAVFMYKFVFASVYYWWY